jgi:UTP--glucose-1-phosphate uridylyltransferase
MKAVIPAAGMSLNFLPLTKAQPKEMLPVGDKPVIQHVVEELVSAGIDDIIIVTGREKRSIEDHFDRSVELEQLLEAGKSKYSQAYNDLVELSDRARIHFIRQRDMKGSGGAIYSARKHVGKQPFLVVFGDTIFLPAKGSPPVSRQLMDIHEKNRCTVLAIDRQPTEKLETYGVVKETDVGHGIHVVEELVEKPSMENAPSNWVVAGMFVLEPEIFDYIRKTPARNGSDIPIPGALDLIARKSKILAYEFRGKRFDIDNIQDWHEANKFFMEK